MVVVSSDEPTTKAAPATEGRRNRANEIPWGAILTNRVSLVLFATFFTQNWIINMLLSEIPSYFTDELGFELEESSLLSIAPYLTQLASVVGFGQLFKYLQQNNSWPTRKVRQYAQFIAFGGASVCLVICSFSPDPYMGFAFVVISMAFFGATQSGVGCSFLDVSPLFGSNIYTVANFCGAVAGIIAPIIVSGATSQWEGSWGWRFVFLLTALYCYVALFLWYNFQTSNVVPELNTPARKKEEESSGSESTSSMYRGSL
jgi:MFS family permease